MRNIKRVLLGVCIGLVCSGALAQVFKCEENGRQVFSDRPCPNAESEEIQVRYIKHDEEEAAVIEERTAAAQEQSREGIRQRQIDRQQSEIDRLERERDNKIEVLRRKKAYAMNNMAGATWEQSISAEMSAIAEQYRQKIEVEHAKLNRMIDER